MKGRLPLALVLKPNRATASILTSLQIHHECKQLTGEFQKEKRRYAGGVGGRLQTVLAMTILNVSVVRVHFEDPTPPPPPPLSLSLSLSLCICVRVCVCVCARARACVRACVRARACERQGGGEREKNVLSHMVAIAD